MKSSWFFSNRAGEDACAPSTMVVDYLHSFYREWDFAFVQSYRKKRK